MEGLDTTTPWAVEEKIKKREMAAKFLILEGVFPIEKIQAKLDALRFAKPKLQGAHAAKTLVSFGTSSAGFADLFPKGCGKYFFLFRGQHAGNGSQRCGKRFLLLLVKSSHLLRAMVYLF
jgi:hypothetical protein